MSRSIISTLSALGLLAAPALVPTAAQAQDQDPNACRQGYVLRQAFPGDDACVTPATRAETAADNRMASIRRASGLSDACLLGYVWREAAPQDHVCVSPAIHHEAVSDSATAPMRAPAIAPAATPLSILRIPAPPLHVGCRRFVKNEWREVACATDDYVKKHYPHPEWQFSVKSTPRLFALSRKGGIDITVPLASGEIAINFLSDPTVATEIDNTYGSNAFSIQANTNFFNGNNGHTDWVQFADQSKPGQPDGVCVWNVDVTVAGQTKNQSGYTATCIPAPTVARPLTGPNASIGAAAVSGYVSAPPAGSKTGLLTVLAYLPWAGGWWSIAAPDTYGLGGQWNEVSGSIMGFGKGSQASFTKTTLQTVVNGYSCLAPYTAPSCSAAAGTLFNSTALSPGAVAYYSGVTAESNNLVPTIGSAPQNEPQINCIDATWCQDNYDVSAP